MPRVIVRQAHRAKAESSTTEEYLLRNVAIPFCDYITSELNTRFSEDNRPGKALFSLLPKHIINVTDAGEMVKSLSRCGMVMAPSSLRHEISVWKRKRSIVDSIDSKFDNLVECLSELDGNIFPN